MRKNIINLFLISFLLFSANAKASSKKPLKFELQPRSHYEKPEAVDIDDETFCNALGLFKKSEVPERVIRAKHLIIAYIVQKVDEGDEVGIDIAREELESYDPTFWNMAITLAKSRK